MWTDVVTVPPVIAVEIHIRPIVAARWLLKQEMRRQHLSQVALGAAYGAGREDHPRIVTGKVASLELVRKALAAVGVRPALAV